MDSAVIVAIITSTAAVLSALFAVFGSIFHGYATEKMKGGSVMSLLFQAIYYANEFKEEDHYETAIELCQQAIDEGCADACGFMGFCYMVAEPPLQDYGQAYECFVKGEETDSDYALFGLGRCYQKGYIVKKDESKAVERIPTHSRYFSDELVGSCACWHVKRVLCASL